MEAFQAGGGVVVRETPWRDLAFQTIYMHIIYMTNYRKAKRAS